MSAETLAFTYGVVGRWFSYLSVVAMVGVAGFTIGVRRPWRAGSGNGVVAIERRSLWWVFGAALVLLGATSWRLYAQTYSVFGLDESVTWEHLRIVAFDTAWGTGWIWQLGAAGLAALLLASALAVKRWETTLVAIAAAAVLIVLPLTGHAVSREEAPWLSVVLQVLHVGAAGLWVGTLLVVMTILRPSDHGAFAAAVRAFSPLAVAAVTTLIGSGLITAIVYLESISELWRGAYGRTLVLKLVLFASVAMFGAYNWRRLRPVLEQHDKARLLNRTAGVELLLAVLTLAVTAVLVALPLGH